MWFKVLAYLLAALCGGKAVIALLAPNIFYRFRQRQYASARRPWSVLLAPAYVLALTGVAWYASFAHPAAWSWILTAFLTMISLLGLANLARWADHRQAVGAAIATQLRQRTYTDVVILGLGLGFLCLGLFVY